MDGWMHLKQTISCCVLQVRKDNFRQFPNLFLPAPSCCESTLVPLMGVGAALWAGISTVCSEQQFPLLSSSKSNSTKRKFSSNNYFSKREKVHILAVKTKGNEQKECSQKGAWFIFSLLIGLLKGSTFWNHFNVQCLWTFLFWFLCMELLKPPRIIRLHVNVTHVCRHPSKTCSTPDRDAHSLLLCISTLLPCLFLIHQGPSLRQRHTLTKGCHHSNKRERAKKIHCEEGEGENTARQRETERESIT